jgi:hypothetical protein
MSVDDVIKIERWVEKREEYLMLACETEERGNHQAAELLFRKALLCDGFIRADMKTVEECSFARFLYSKCA